MKSSQANRRWAVLIGSGLALSPVHNEWLTRLVTQDGMVGFFLPSFGYAIWIMATLLFLTWKVDWRKLDWGDKRVFIPLLVIVGAIGLSGITANTWTGKFAPLLMGLSLFALYLVARKLGKDMFLPLAIGAGIASLGVIAHSIVFPGKVTGGFVFQGNYDIVVGYVLLGVALFVHRHQWVLAMLALVAICLSGSPEGVFVLGVMAIAVLWRRDWNRKLIFAVSPVVIVGALYFGLGHGQKLYSYALEIVQDVAVVEQVPMIDGERAAIGYRIWVIKEAMANIKPLGEGYNITAFRKGIVHNVPLVIVQQLGWAGILAGMAWLWVSVWCLVRTRWKYVWVMVLALSVFDHYIFTQLAPFYWAIVGVSTASSIKSDMLFRRE